MLPLYDRRRPNGISVDNADGKTTVAIRNVNIFALFMATSLMLLATSICSAKSAHDTLETYPVTLHAHRVLFLTALRRICNQAHCTVSYGSGVLPDITSSREFSRFAAS